MLSFEEKLRRFRAQKTGKRRQSPYKKKLIVDAELYADLLGQTHVPREAPHGFAGSTRYGGHSRI